MEFSFIVNASAERSQGKFEARETIEAEMLEALEQASPGSITGENGGEYEVTDWSVEENVTAKPAKPVKVKAPAVVASPLPITSLIRSYLKIQHEQYYTDKVLDELLADLKSIADRYPNIVQQELAKLSA